MAIGTAAAIIGGAAISGVGSLIGGRQASKAAGKAADVQAQSAQAGIAEQQRQFDVTQESLAPFREAGVSALEQQRILLGLGASPEGDPNAALRDSLESELAGLSGAPSGGGSGGALSQAFNQFTASQAGDRRAEIESQLAGLGEFIPVGELSPQEKLAQQQQAFAAFSESPGQKFIRDRAQRNLVRNQSAIGGLGGGNVRSALVQQGAGFAQQDFQNQFGRLGQLAGQGQATAVNLGQFGAQTAGNVANLGIAGAEARASGILGQQQAQAQTFGNIAQLGGLALGSLSQPPVNQFNPGSFFGGS